MLRSTALAVLLTVIPSLLQAQDLSGTWEGSGGGNNFRFVLIKCGDKYVGHNYDTDGLIGYCKTNIEAIYDPSRQRWKVQSKGFISHTLGHSQTNFSLAWSATGQKEQLRGSFYAKNAMVKVMSLGIALPLTLWKISNNTDTTAFMKAALQTCIPAVPSTLVSLNNPPGDSNEVVTATATTSEIQQQLLETSMRRRNLVIKTIPTNSRDITITLYDNGVQDGDSISIVCDSTVIADRIAVTLQPVSFRIRLDERYSSHQVILIAHNLGSIPPNTATIEVTAGTKKFTLTALSDLGSNAVIRFIYNDE